MAELHSGPTGQRRGRGARERLLAAAAALFRQRGINSTGMNELCAVAQVSKRTAYQHFAGKDELVAEYLRGQDADVLPEVFDDPSISPREQLLAMFASSPRSGDDVTPLCPFIGAAVEITDPGHPARQAARDYKEAIAARLTVAARRAGAVDPEQLGAQLALLYDGASTQTRIHGVEMLGVAAQAAAVLVDRSIPG